MEILKYPIATEKAIRMIESDNVISFVVGQNATKGKIKDEIEKRFKVKVDKVRVMISPKGVKKAYVKLKKEFRAIDVATQLGLM
ncbi:MAG: 50S ribosomal protein L23 [Nanoarchaeota archaeon]|nr:50S ribosomal protein L23 [Nanoarchaeota archaeon]